MENMLHLAPSQALPLDRCIFSSEHQLPQAISATASLPVIDMSRGRSEVRRAILDAGMEFGFFMVMSIIMSPIYFPALLLPDLFSLIIVTNNATN